MFYEAFGWIPISPMQKDEFNGSQLMGIPVLVGLGGQQNSAHTAVSEN